MGGIISGAGSIYSGVAGLTGDMGNLQYQRDTNEALDDYQARTAKLQGNIAAGKARMQGSQMVAAQRFAYANSGIDEKTGTAAAVQADTGAQSELDAQTIQNNAARQAWGFKLAKGNEEQRYVAGVSAAQNKAAGSFLTGASQVTNSVGSFGAGG